MHTYSRRGPEGAHCLNLHIKFNQRTMFRSLGPSSGYFMVWTEEDSIDHVGQSEQTT